ncbi:hypothetical protein [Devosia sp. 63-57]|uniref:hypothetical protein n=1 Tax=Devosia sp. 63-57 TaxID=1895751 RepID=UPI00086846D4|nr:hypothetical protein [Devosia sp. 63-57]ODT47754.1 MAG: hypothetical protein ABS74_16090 [Pelagibacterium sp. SCN 63-126]OJX42537.1 MAG: hypothetical protein BGO80_13765 [Devosia sp. 63-57]
MLSDVLYEANTRIRHYQVERAQMYSSLKERLDALRAQMIVLQMELDLSPSDTIEVLHTNPFYIAALAGDPGPSDAYMDGDDTLRDAWVEQYAKQFGKPTP